MKKNISDSLYGVYQAPLDAKLAPVNTVADLNLIPRAHRYIGMTIMVLNTDIDEEPCEYWLANGTTDEDWVKKSVNLTGYATEEFVNEAVSELADEVTEALNTETERTNSAITSAVTELEKAIATAIQNETARTEDTYLKEHQSLVDYYTSAQTNSAITNAINTESARTDTAISNAIAAETARTEDTYLKEHQSLANYYTSGQTDSAITNAANEIKDIIEENEEVTASAFNQLNEKFTDYYTSAETDNAITTAINDKVVNIYRYKGSVSTYAELPSQNLEVGDVYNVEAAYGDIPAGTNFAWKGNAWDPLGGSVDLSAYWTSAGTQSAITSAITDAIAAETARTEQRYLTEHQSLAAYYTSAQTNSAITSAITDITEIIEDNEKVTAFAITELNEQVTGITDSLSNYYTSAETESAITSAITGISQNLLPQVSSTDNGKILQVANGAWTLVTPTTLYSGSSTPDNQQGNNGDIYVQTGE